IFGGYSTRTRFTTLTSTILYTCVTQLGGTGSCGGRRKRSDTINRLNEDPTWENEQDMVSGRELESSVGLDGNKLSRNEFGYGPGLSPAKFFLAITSFTTMTLTSFSTNKSTTVSVSFLCRPNFDGVPDNCA
ncbi:unnamed protein product, partial [Meganyctiphanes norvegica]